MAAKKYYDDWEEACMNSKRKVAVGRAGKYDILKSMHKGGYFTYKNLFMNYPGIGKASAQQVDSIRRWEAI